MRANVKTCHRKKTCSYRRNTENARFDWISCFLTLLKYVFSRSKLIKHSRKSVLLVIIWNMINFMNVSKLIELINDVMFISKMKLIDFVVLWLILIELSKCCNVSNWSIFAFDFAAVSESMRSLFNSKKSYRDFVIVLNTYDVNGVGAIISSRLLIWWIKEFSANCSTMINDSKFSNDSYEMKN